MDHFSDDRPVRPEGSPEFAFKKEVANDERISEGRGDVRRVSFDESINSLLAETNRGIKIIKRAEQRNSPPKALGSYKSALHSSAPKSHKHVQINTRPNLLDKLELYGRQSQKGEEPIGDSGQRDRFLLSQSYSPSTGPLSSFDHQKFYGRHRGELKDDDEDQKSGKASESTGEETTSNKEEGSQADEGAEETQRGEDEERDDGINNEKGNEDDDEGNDEQDQSEELEENEEEQEEEDEEGDNEEGDEEQGDEEQGDEEEGDDEEGDDEEGDDEEGGDEEGEDEAEEQDMDEQEEEELYEGDDYEEDENGEVRGRGGDGDDNEPTEVEGEDVGSDPLKKLEDILMFLSRISIVIYGLIYISSYINYQK